MVHKEFMVRSAPAFVTGINQMKLLFSLVF